MRKHARICIGWAGAAVAIAALCLCVTTPVSAEEYAARVNDLREAENLQEAAAVACEWAAGEPGSTAALHSCAELAAAVGRYAPAEEALRSLLFHTPGDPDVRVALGEVLLQRGLSDDAREQFRAAIQAGGEPGPAYTGLARATINDAESPGDMLSAAEVVLAVAPDYPGAHAVMGAALRELGRLDEAVQVLLQARERYPEYPRTNFELGLTWALMGEATQAQRAWERYAKMEPHSPESWLLRHRLLLTATEDISDRAFDARYCPDGSRIAYRARGEGGWGIYTIPAEGDGPETKLWAAEANVQSFAWSPTGDRIAVMLLERQEAGGKQQWIRKLLLLPAEGGESEVLLETGNMGEIAWNPANGRIGVRTHVPRQGHTILQIDPESGDSEEVSGLEKGAIHYAPAWSPDGATMMAARRGTRRPDGSFAFDLLVGPADDFANAQVIHRVDELPRNPTFTPDGSAIIYALPSGDTAFRIWAMPTDGSRDPVLVDRNTGRLATPDISPDGRFLLTTRETMLVRATLAGIEE